MSLGVVLEWIRTFDAMENVCIVPQRPSRLPRTQKFLKSKDSRNQAGYFTIYPRWCYLHVPNEDCLLCVACHYEKRENWTNSLHPSTMVHCPSKCRESDQTQTSSHIVRACAAHQTAKYFSRITSCLEILVEGKNRNDCGVLELRILLKWRDLPSGKIMVWNDTKSSEPCWDQNPT